MRKVYFCLTVNEFINKYSEKDIIPMKKTKEIQYLLENRNIYISELYFESDRNPYFFLEFINKIKKDYMCFVINYTIYKNDLFMLTNKYKGEILFDSKNENQIYFELNNTLADKNSKLDWFDIWGHVCEGWIMDNKAYNLFKRFLNNDLLLDEEIKDFLNGLKYKFEFGETHESIRFISLNDNLVKYNEDDIMIN